MSTEKRLGCKMRGEYEGWFFRHVVRARWRVFAGMLFLSTQACLAPEIVVSAAFDAHPDEVAAIKAAAAEWNRATNGESNIVLTWHGRGDMTGHIPLYRSEELSDEFEGNTKTHNFGKVVFSQYITLYVNSIARDQERLAKEAVEAKKPVPNVFFRAILHEFGHHAGILAGYGEDGLGHTFQPGAAMNFEADTTGECVGVRDLELYAEATGSRARPRACEPVVVPSEARQEQP